MKNLLLIFTLFIFGSCSNQYKNLYEHTDYFVESLETTYNSYGLLGGLDHQKITEDSLYQITPMGRLINVKILEVVEFSEYEDLKEKLKDHYEKDTRVNDVYICNGGTVMIDCRN